MLERIVAEANPWWTDPGARPGEARRWPRRRDVFADLRRLVEHPRSSRAVVLLGPRQSGKTVLVGQLAGALLDAGAPPATVVRFDFSDERLTAPWPAPRDVLACAPRVRESTRRYLLFDEVQRVPQWDRWLKRAVDEGGVKALATGSSSLRLREGSIESGTGRWDEVRIEGLTFVEFLELVRGEPETRDDYLQREPAALERFLALGGSPARCSEAPSLELRRTIRSDVVDRSILKDLRPTGVDVAKVKDLFVYLVGSSGARFQATARASDLDADPRSVREYVRLLEDACLVASLPEYPRRISGGRRTSRAQLRSRPKIYAADHGAIAAFSFHSEPTADPDTRARIFEATVFRHLRWAATKVGFEPPWFYRAADGVDLDFVIDLRGALAGIEVTSRQIDSRKLERVVHARQRLSCRRTLVVGPAGSRPRSAAPDSPSIVDLESFLLDPLSHLVADEQE